MAVRTFYWHSRVIGGARLLRQRVLRRDTSHLFRKGNAGDIYNVDVIRRTYGTDAVNVSDDGRRLLLIGSTAHNVRDGDVVCGIGTKGVPIPSAADAKCLVLAVRGPITLEAFAAAGHDTGSVRSQLDPGLLIRFDVAPRPPVSGRVGLLPHYRERTQYRGRVPKGMQLIDIDNDPVAVARKIQDVELLYTSSLHGMIFAHALGRPCVLIRPLTPEGELKYQDYMASVGLTWRPWVPLDDARRSPSPTSPVDLEYQPADFALPTIETLRTLGVAD
jgi:pyruvyltransferase